VGTQTKAELLTDQDIIDMEAFGQLMELDDDDDSSFSESITLEYFDQASRTFEEMDENLSVYLRYNHCVLFLPTFRHNFREAKNVKRLGELAHFLKGSSGQVGVRKVKDECNRMQYYGKLRDEEKKVDLKEEQALEMITASLKVAKKDHEEAEKLLKEYFDAPGDPPRPSTDSSDSDDPPPRKK